jgi:ATP-dependent Lon protease
MFWQLHLSGTQGHQYVSVSLSRINMESENINKVTPLQVTSEGEQFREGNKQPIPVLPVRDTVLFPHAVLPLTVGRESSIQLINSLGEEKTILVVAQREARVDTPQPTDLYNIGTLATVHKVVKMPNQSLFVFTEGLQRAKLGEFSQLTPFLRASVDLLPDDEPQADPEIEALQRNVLTLFQQIVAVSPTLSDELQTVAINIEEQGRLVDFVAYSLPFLSTKE